MAVRERSGFNLSPTELDISRRNSNEVSTACRIVDLPELFAPTSMLKGANSISYDLKLLKLAKVSLRT